MQMADMSFGLTREDVMRMVFLIVDKSGREHRSAMVWLEEDVSRDLEHVTHNWHSSLPSLYHTARHFAPTQKSFKTVETNGYLQMLDETAVSVVHKPGKVVAEMGRRFM